MAVIHITEAEAASDFPALLEKAIAGEEVMIHVGNQIVTLVRRPVATRDPLLPRYAEPRPMADILADIQQQGSSSTLDDRFGDDLEKIMKENRRPGFDPWEAA